MEENKLLIPTIYGLGYIGIGKYNPKIYIKTYNVWKSMFERCYSGNKIHYINCSIVEEWFNFQNFAEWFETYYIENFYLDKDILFKGNKIYSPDTCCFVPERINNLFCKSNNTRGNLPIGVRILISGRYRACVSYINDIDKKTILNCGTHTTKIEAFNSYKYNKEIIIKNVALKFNEFILKNFNDKLKNNINFSNKINKIIETLNNYQVEITD